MTAVKVSMRKEVANKGRNGSCLQEFFWEGRGFFLSCPMAEICYWVDATENRCAIPRPWEPLLVPKHNFIYLTLQPGRQQVTRCLFQILTFCDAITFLWQILLFFLSNNVFEIKLIIMFQRRETLSYTLCGPTVPRTIKKIHKNCSINVGCLIFFDILLCPSSCHNHWSWSTSYRASKRKNSHTHMHGYLDGAWEGPCP